MTIKDKILLESKLWVLEKLALDKNHFQHLTRLHSANILWIGSSDSPVPVRELTNTEPGEIIVHQNMANQIREDDISLMATVEHAIEDAGIEYIIICGYSHCRGIQDVILDEDNTPFVRKWLGGLLELYENNAESLWRMNLDEKKKRLCELNIRQQIENLSQLDIIQRAWKRNNSPVLLGWYFDLHNGSIKEIFSMEAKTKLKQMASV